MEELISLPARSYTYNADGTRHSKSTQTNVTKTTTYYYVEGVLYAVESPVYTVVFQFDDTGRPYGFRLLRNDSPGYESRLYYKYNLQGDVVGIYDCVGNEVVTYTYDPWGKLLSATGVSILIDANPLLYRGYVYDKETGFYYCNSRYYDPETGRWLNADKYISTGQGLLGYNMFVYCNNNPCMYVDHTGEFPWLIAAVIVACGVGGGVLGYLSDHKLWESTDSAQYVPPPQTIGPKESPLNLYENDFSTDSEELTTGDRVLNTIIGVGGGLAVGGVAISSVGVVGTLALGSAGATIPFLGATGAETFAYGALAFDFFAMFIAPILGIDVEPIEYAQ